VPATLTLENFPQPSLWLTACLRADSWRYVVGFSN
jgi:hypothetical protein